MLETPPVGESSNNDIFGGKCIIAMSRLAVVIISLLGCGFKRSTKFPFRKSVSSFVQTIRSIRNIERVVDRINVEIISMLFSIRENKTLSCKGKYRTNNARQVRLTALIRHNNVVRKQTNNCNPF